MAENATGRTAPIDIARICGSLGLPAAVAIYGELGTGKSVAMHAAFHGRIFYIGENAGLKSAASTLGVSLDPRICIAAPDLRIAQSKAREIVRRAPGRFLAVGLDDVSLLAKATYYPIADRYDKRHVFDKAEDVKRVFYEFAQFLLDLQHLGLFPVLNFHSTEPSTSNEGMFIKGGPTMPWKSLMGDVPRVVDLLLRTGTDPDITGDWKGVFRVENANPRWHEKDRFSVCPDSCPQSIYEILRAAGYAIPRPAGLEWMEDAVAEVARGVASGSDPYEIGGAVQARLMADDGRSMKQTAWAVRDGWARYALAQHGVERFLVRRRASADASM